MATVFFDSQMLMSDSEPNFRGVWSGEICAQPYMDSWIKQVRSYDDSPEAIALRYGLSLPSASGDTLCDAVDQNEDSSNGDAAIDGESLTFSDEQILTEHSSARSHSGHPDQGTLWLQARWVHHSLGEGMVGH